MKSEQVSNTADGRSFILVLETGDEAFAAITQFAVSEGLLGASLTAIGAFERATVGWFDLVRKTYKHIEVNEQCEALSLVGDVALGDDGKPSLHIHAVLGLRDGSVRGGHLIEAIVRPTLEVVLRETPAVLRRKKRADLGIALIDLAK